MAKITRALVSVSDKTGLVDFVRGLREFGVEILSTGGTATLLADAGIPVVPVSDAHRLAGDPRRAGEDAASEDPRRYSGPARRPRGTASRWRPTASRRSTWWSSISTRSRPRWRVRTAPSRTRSRTSTSAGRRCCGRRRRTTTTSPSSSIRPTTARCSTRCGAAAATVAPATNARLARKAFQTTARYDGAIADYLGSLDGRERKHFGETLHLGSDQGAGPALRREPAPAGGPVRRVLPRRPAAARQGAVIQQHRRHQRGPAADAGVRRRRPGRRWRSSSTTRRAAWGRRTRCAEAYQRAFATDPESPFGGIVITNQPWTLELAREVDEIFTEVLIAPDFAPDALEFLQQQEEPAAHALAARGDATARQARSVACAAGPSCRTPIATARIRAPVAS